MTTSSGGEQHEGRHAAERAPGHLGPGFRLAAMPIQWLRQQRCGLAWLHVRRHLEGTLRRMDESTDCIDTGLDARTTGAADLAHKDQVQQTSLDVRGIAIVSMRVPSATDQSGGYLDKVRSSDVTNTLWLPWHWPRPPQVEDGLFNAVRRRT
ncbi:MAG: hypothetical protein VX589_17325 [Myxococcota bacterium]|nr:hypothetical protein [Myxococcota bacterium]